MASTEGTISIKNSIVLGERLLCHLIESATNDSNEAPTPEIGAAQSEIGDVVRIICRNGKMKLVHRLVFSSVLPNFMELVGKGGEAAGTIRLDVRPEVIDIVLNFIYTTQEVMIPHSLILETYAFAKHFEFEEMSDEISRVISTTEIGAIIEKEDCFDTVTDRDVIHLSELLKEVDLSVDIKCDLLKKIHRWSKLQESRAGPASDISEWIFNHPGTSTSNRTDTRIPSPDEQNPTREARPQTHVMCWVKERRTIEIYRLNDRDPPSGRELVGCFKLPEEEGLPSNTAVLKGNYFTHTILYNALRTYRIGPSGITDETNLLSMTVGYSELTTSGSSIYAWNRSKVDEVVCLHPLVFKSAVTKNSIGGDISQVFLPEPRAWKSSAASHYSSIRCFQIDFLPQ